MTRVLFLTESFHPVLGGGEGHVRDLSRRLAASGMPATVITRRGDRAWPARETLDGVSVVRVPPAGPGRAGKYAMVPAALVAAVARVARLRRPRGPGDAGAGPARPRGGAIGAQGGRAAAGGERRDDGRGVHLGHRARSAPPARRGEGGRGRAQPAPARRRRLRGHVAPHPARRSWRSGVAPEKVRHIPHGVDTERFRPATPEERAGAAARGSACRQGAAHRDLHRPAAAGQGAGDAGGGLSGSRAQIRSRAPVC